MNLIFKIKRVLFKFRLRKLSIINPNEYDEKIEDKKYILLDTKIIDKYAVKDFEIKKFFTNLEEYETIKKEYAFPYNNNITDIENSLNIMNYLTQHTHYCGATSNVLPDNTLDILKYSFDKSFAYALNCRFKALVLTDVLIAYGIKALPILLRSENNGVHFVVHIYSKEQKKFVVLDPSFNCCFTDENDNLLSVFELRNAIIDKKTVKLKNYSFQNTEKHKEYYFSAFISDCISNISTWGTNERSKKIKNKVCGIEFDTKIPLDLE